MLRAARRCFSVLLPPQSARDSGKLTVVFDLDETLAYTFHPDDASGYQYKPDIKDDAFYPFPEKQTQLYIYKRPHLESFLEFIDEGFEPIVWATGEKLYADKVIDAIDPKGIFRTRLYQDDCTYFRAWKYPQFEFLKDIRRLGRDLARVIVVDDDWQGMYFQPDNFIHIDRYEAWYEDSWLINELPEYLSEMNELPDVRPSLRAKFMLKYHWAMDDQLFELSKEDERMLEFLMRPEALEYNKLKLKYEEIYKLKTQFIPADKLW